MGAHNESRHTKDTQGRGTQEAIETKLEEATLRISKGAGRAKEIKSTKRVGEYEKQ